MSSHFLSTPLSTDPVSGDTCPFSRMFLLTKISLPSLFENISYSHDIRGTEIATNEQNNIEEKKEQSNWRNNNKIIEEVFVYKEFG